MSSDDRTDVEAWLARRTWSKDVLDLDEVRDRLRSRTVSVVIPALNEADTVGAVVSTIHELVDEGTVDELVVVDGGSDDGTPEIAADAGARVIGQGEAVTGIGPITGKGDSMWKGLANTRGELVVFADADVRTLEADWIVSLVAPMVLDDGVGYVKALYDRPSHDEHGGAGGGRVTEILARPLLNAFWPQLAGVAQPLGGEYAGRRQVLEVVPFVTGYGVELGLLLDIAARFGADAIAQVDVGVRVHDSQPLDNLGRMAAEILAVAADRLSAEGRLRADVLPRLLQPRREESGRLTLEAHDADRREHPPLERWRRSHPAGH